MNDNEETRSWNQLAAECKRLEKELKDVKVKLGLAVIVNTDLQREKQARLDPGVNLRFGEHMFESGVMYDRYPSYGGLRNKAIDAAIAEWK